MQVPSHRPSPAITPLAVLGFVLLTATARAQPPPAADMVVTTSWLAARLADPHVAVIAVADPDDYARGHVPGAHRIAHDVTIDAAHRLIAPDALARALARAGARDNARIVLYGDSPMETGWIYMALASLGHADHISLLSGNLAAWRADGHPVSRDAAPAGTGTLTPRPAPDIIVDAAWVRARLDNPAIRLIDARTTREWDGGRLPGATLVLWQDLYQDAEQGRFRPRAEIRALLEKAGVGPGSQAVTYCAVGMRASLMYFAARYVGYDARVYVGSWQDWRARSGYPVVR